MKNFNLKLLYFFVIFTPFVGLADIPSEHACRDRSFSLDEFRGLALNESPIVTEIDSEYAKNLAKAVETSVLANPELQIEQVFTSMNIGGANDHQSNISFGQGIRLSDFGQKSAVADLISRAGDLDRKIKLLELNQNIKIFYYSLVNLQATFEIQNSAGEQLQKKENLVREGLKKGLFSKGAEKLFEAERYRNEATKSGIQSAIHKLNNQIQENLGIKCNLRVSEMSKPAPLPPLEDLHRIAESSEISIASRFKLLENLAGEELKLAELDTVPQVTPKFLYQHTNDGGDFFGGGITVPFPFWNRNQANKLRANAELNLIKKRKQSYSPESFKNLLSNLHISITNLENQYTTYQKKVIPTFKEALNSQEDMYRQGRGNILEVYQTFKFLNEAHIQELNFRLEAMQARQQLSTLIGEDL